MQWEISGKEIRLDLIRELRMLKSEHAISFPDKGTTGNGTLSCWMVMQKV